MESQKMRKNMSVIKRNDLGLFCLDSDATSIQTMIKEAVYIQILDKISVQIEGATTRMCFDFISS